MMNNNKTAEKLQKIYNKGVMTYLCLYVVQKDKNGKMTESNLMIKPERLGLESGSLSDEFLHFIEEMAVIYSTYNLSHPGE